MKNYSMPVERKELLLRLERLIGNECYNGSIQNWGAHGIFEGEGREFRYPITFLDENGMKEKSKYPDKSISSSKLITGYYAFGANQLQIMRGLEKVLSLLESEFDLQIKKSIS